ncbi:Uncharacterised protein [Chlamydia trachomatis]|nr:Uncharacterised protein [Chlamydia trachomatis]
MHKHVIYTLLIRIKRACCQIRRMPLLHKTLETLYAVDVRNTLCIVVLSFKCNI